MRSGAVRASSCVMSPVCVVAVAVRSGALVRWRRACNDEVRTLGSSACGGPAPHAKRSDLEGQPAM